MAKKKKQTIGYKYFASGHFVLCHGPIDAITKISFQDKDAYLNEENVNKTIYINKPSLFGGDEQSGGVHGNIELLLGHADQQKSSTLQRICAKISNSFGGLISAYRGVCSVVFDNVYIGTAPNMPDSKWRVKRIHTRHDGQAQWYDEKAEINSISLTQSYAFDLRHTYYIESEYYKDGVVVFDRTTTCESTIDDTPFYAFELSPGNGAMGFALARHAFHFLEDLRITVNIEISSSPTYRYEFKTSAKVLSSEIVEDSVGRRAYYTLTLKNGDFFEAWTGEGNSISLNVLGRMVELSAQAKEADIKGL